LLALLIVAVLLCVVGIVGLFTRKPAQADTPAVSLGRAAALDREMDKTSRITSGRH
jgi:hypothetical protein